MNAIFYTLSTAWKEVQLILRDRGALAVSFLMPLVLGLMMGGGNLIANSEETAAVLLNVCLVNQDTGDFGMGIVEAIESIEELNVETYTTLAQAEEQVATGEAAAAVIIPASFSQDINAYTPTTVVVIIDPGQPESASIVTGIMNQVVAEVTIWGEVQYGIRAIMERSDVPAEISEQQQLAAEAQTLGVIMTTLNEMRANPAIAVVSEDMEGAKIEGGIEIFFALLFPGFTVMFIFFNVAFAAASILKERESGTLRRLLAAPAPRGTIIAGKILAYMLLSCVQVVLMFGVASILFRMPLGQSPVALVVLTIVVAAVASAMGMMVAAMAKSADQAGNIGTLLGFVMGALGGCIPAFSKTPLVRSEGALGIISNLTPQGHALEAYYRLLAENGGLVDILPQLGILLVVGVAFFLIATWRFKFEQ